MVFFVASNMVVLWARVFGSAYGVTPEPNGTTKGGRWIWIDEITVDHGPCFLEP